MKKKDITDRDARFFSVMMAFCSVLLIVAVFLFLLYYNSGVATYPVQVFIPFMLPSFVIFCILLICYSFAHRKVRRADIPPPITGIIRSIFGLILKRIIPVILVIILVLNVSFVFLQYRFSRDESFDDWPAGKPGLDEVATIRPVVGESSVPEKPETRFKEQVDYWQQLKSGPGRQIDIRHVEAIKEARRILSPLKMDIEESSARNRVYGHAIPPDIIATFILANEMMKKKKPTYSLAGCIFHVVYRFFRWENKPLQDFVMKAMTDGIEIDDDNPVSYWLATQTLKIFNIPLQDRVWDISAGLVLGSSPTMGLMQVRANAIQDVDFLKFLKLGEEKNVKQNGLWDRVGIDAENLSERRINWMLYTDPQLGIEAGTAALRLALEDFNRDQRKGDIPTMPVIPDIREIIAGDWMYPKFDSLITRKYGPDLMMELIARNEVFTYPTMTQRFTNCLSFSPAKHLPWLHMVVWESGVFDRSEIDAIIVGVNETNREYLLEIAHDREHPYLQKAAQVSIHILSSTNPQKNGLR